MNVVWFKRDFRLRDHQPLAQAVAEGLPIVLVAFYEPALVKNPHYDTRHWDFVKQSVSDINRQLQPINQKLLLLEIEPHEFFNQLHKQHQLQTVFSYQETGENTSYERDKHLIRWFHDHRIEWREFQNNGVIRGKKNRNQWTAQWHQFMEKPIEELDLKNLPRMPDLSEDLLEKSGIKLEVRDSVYQRGGETEAWKTMDSFFENRFEKYAKQISKPLLSRESCSRLSPYLAWGNLSMRQVYQRYLQERQDPKKRFQLDFFANRLHWHCHFIQKFEMEPRMEFETVNHGYKNLGRRDDPALHQLVVKGQTGFPLVDACLRCVAKTGYINFRMRAMLVSFYTHHLWLNWQPFAHWLARQFLDFEPGIHYGQFQMQSAVTGINTVRIYNPVKQSQEHDPDAEFILKWVPELKKLPIPLVHEPWKCSAMEEMLYDFELGKDYPRPVVDIEETGKHAREVLWKKLKDPDVKKDANRVLKKHTNPGRKRMK